MGKKLDLANKNIIELIDEIIGYESIDVKDNCPNPYSYGKFDCPMSDNERKVSCDECTEIYLDWLKEKMIRKYIVVKLNIQVYFYLNMF